MKRRWRSLPSTRTGVAPFCLVGGATLVVAPRHWFLGGAGDWKERLEAGKDLKAKGLVKSWGHPQFIL
jgi:hypothetical protein